MSEPKELTLSIIKEYLLSKGGKVKYCELFEHFRNLIVDSTTDDKFQEFVSNIAIKKYENDSSYEWIILKKKYMDTSTTSPPNAGFFASTLQKTKHNLTKFSTKAFSQYRDRDANKSSFLSSSSAHNIATASSSSTSSSSSSIRRKKLHDSGQTSLSASNLTSVISDNLDESSLASSSSSSQRNSSNVTTEVDSLISSVNSLNINNVSVSNESTNNITCFEGEENDETLRLDSTHNTTVIATNNRTNSSADQSVYIKSVKEQAKKLNRLNTESELRGSNEMSGNRLGLAANRNSASINTGVKFRDHTNQHPKTVIKNIEVESFDFSNPNPNEKEWILVCSRGDYHEIARFLLKTPYLAQKKDPFNGYTCAHWACKHGNVEVLKLVASTLENDTKTNERGVRINHIINSKTRAGYTCLHLAYLYNHGDMVPFLKTYGAEGLTDYSGKIGIDYSRLSTYSENNSANSNNSNLNETTASKIVPSLNTTQDFLNDTSAIIKRSTSVILNKESQPKEEFNSMKLPDPKQRPKIVNLGFGIQTNALNPLNPMAFLSNQEPRHNIATITPHSLSRSNSRNENDQVLDQTADQTITETSLVETGKENIFI